MKWKVVHVLDHVHIYPDAGLTLVNNPDVNFELHYYIKTQISLLLF